MFEVAKKYNHLVNICGKVRNHEAGNIESAKKLLEDKDIIDNINTKSLDEYNRTPLHYACRYGYIEIVKLLITRGADINIIDDHIAFRYVLRD